MRRPEDRRCIAVETALLELFRLICVCIADDVGENRKGHLLHLHGVVVWGLSPGCSLLPVSPVIAPDALHLRGVQSDLDTPAKTPSEQAIPAPRVFGGPASPVTRRSGGHVDVQPRVVVVARGHRGSNPSRRPWRVPRERRAACAGACLGRAARAPSRLTRPAIGAGVTDGMFGETGTIGWIGSMAGAQACAMSRRCLRRCGVARGLLRAGWDQVRVRGCSVRSSAARSSASTRWRQTVTAHIHASM